MPFRNHEVKICPQEDKPYSRNIVYKPCILYDEGIEHILAIFLYANTPSNNGWVHEYLLE